MIIIKFVVTNPIGFVIFVFHLINFIDLMSVVMIHQITHLIFFNFHSITEIFNLVINQLFVNNYQSIYLQSIKFLVNYYFIILVSNLNIITLHLLIVALFQIYFMINSIFVLYIITMFHLINFL